MLWLFFIILAIRALGHCSGAGGRRLYTAACTRRKTNQSQCYQREYTILGGADFPHAKRCAANCHIYRKDIFIDVVTAAIAVAVLLLFLHVPVHSKASQKQRLSYHSDLRKVYIYQETWHVKISILLPVLFLAVPVALLTPLHVTRSFGPDVWRLTALEVVFSIGMMLGGIIMAAWGGFKNKVHSMILSIFIVGACTFVLGFIPNFWVFVGIMGVAGIALPIFSTPSTVLLQEKVETDFLGRVFSILVMISNTVMPLGYYCLVHWQMWCLLHGY